MFSNTICGSENTLAYTNLPTIIDERFRDTSKLDGVFSGFNEDSRSYKYDSWQYQGEIVPSTLAEHYVNTTESFAEKLNRIENGPPPKDFTFQHPNCVYQLLKRHYAAYTPEMVERTTGCPLSLLTAGGSEQERLHRIELVASAVELILVAMLPGNLRDKGIRTRIGVAPVLIVGAAPLLHRIAGVVERPR